MPLVRAFLVTSRSEKHLIKTDFDAKVRLCFQTQQGLVRPQPPPAGIWTFLKTRFFNRIQVEATLTTLQICSVKEM